MQIRSEKVGTSEPWWTSSNLVYTAVPHAKVPCVPTRTRRTIATAAASFDFDYFQSFFVISTIASALGTEIDLDVVDTSGSGPY